MAEGFTNPLGGLQAAGKIVTFGDALAHAFELNIEEVYLPTTIRPMLFIIKQDVGGNTALNPARAFQDLFYISDWDYQLGWSPELFVDRVTYAYRTKINTFSGVIKAIVDSAAQVSIAGLASSRGAPTGVQNTVLNSDGSIYILYDADVCGFVGRYTFDDAGQRICVPSPIALYHELVHAYHHIAGTHNSKKEVEEKATIFEENVLRSARSLPLRDLNSWDMPGDCGVGNCGQAAPTEGTDCFVMTVCLRDTGQISSFRQLRDNWAARDDRFAQVLLEFYPQYYEIGLPLSRALSVVPGRVDAVRGLLVIPYLQAWHALFLLSLGDTEKALPLMLRAIDSTNVPARDRVAVMLSERLHEHADAAGDSYPPGLDGIMQCLKWDETGFRKYPLVRWGILELLQLLYSDEAGALMADSSMRSLRRSTTSDPLQRFTRSALSWAAACPSVSGRRLAVDLITRLPPASQ